MSLSNFHHIYIDNQASQTLFLLHGTGADEYDLLPLVESLDSTYNIVSLRGNVTKFGMNRFFALLEPGSFAQSNFDQESIKVETEKLNQFVRTWVDQQKISIDKLAFLGYSNGANMILATLFNYPELINKAILLHALMPFKPAKLDLSGKEFLVTYGESDQLIPAQQSLEVIDYLQTSKASVDIISHPGGHELRPEELVAIRKFFG